MGSATTVSADFWCGGHQNVADINDAKGSGQITGRYICSKDSICNHFSMSSSSLHFTTSEENTELRQVINILNSAEDLMDVDVATKEEIPLEPVPLGPMVSLNLVQQVPLIESASNLLQANQVDVEALFEALNPLMINSGSREVSPSQGDSSCVVSRTTNRGVTTSSFLPAPQRRRLSNIKPEDKNTLSSFHTKTEWDSTTSKDQEELETDEVRFRPYQSDLWKDRFQDLVDFREENGHCMVPHHFPENPQLAQWIKRQRFQYKLKQMKHHSTLTDERQTSLENMDFVWDSHKAAWIERFEALKEFQARHGHCNVPSNYIDRPLAIWVKCQRRQYRLYQKGTRSTMTIERFTQLDQLGFSWNPRNLK